MSTQAANPFAYVRRWDADRANAGWWHSFDLPDGGFIRGVCGIESLRDRIRRFPIPDDLRGKRVLDIGTWDGWFAFEMERRGAEVMAIDCWDNPRFRQMHAIYNSRVDYRQFDMYELTPDRVGRFDIVLFMGVLYHLKHPLLALERVCALTTDFAAVDSFVLREEHRLAGTLADRNIMEFYETDEFGGQFDNWVGPTLSCLMAFCRTAGFARVELQADLEHSACIACYRHWEPPKGIGQPPEIVTVFHHTNQGINFRSQYDEYATAWFRGPDALTLDEVKPEISGYGVRPVHLTRLSGGDWQVKFKLPPVDGPNWHDVRLRIGESLPSSPFQIAIDLPMHSGPLTINRVQDGTLWTHSFWDSTKGDVISVWAEGLPDNADRANVRVLLNGLPLNTQYVEPHRTDRPRQINAKVGFEPNSGPVEIRVAVADQVSPPKNIVIRAAA